MLAPPMEHHPQARRGWPLDSMRPNCQGTRGASPRTGHPTLPLWYRSSSPCSRKPKRNLSLRPVMPDLRASRRWLIACPRASFARASFEPLPFRPWARSTRLLEQLSAGWTWCRAWVSRRPPHRVLRHPEAAGSRERPRAETDLRRRGHTRENGQDSTDGCGTVRETPEIWQDAQDKHRLLCPQRWKCLERRRPRRDSGNSSALKNRAVACVPHFWRIARSALRATPPIREFIRNGQRTGPSRYREVPGV